MPKRKERVAPPPTAGGWDFRFATSDALGKRDSRQHPLKGLLGSRVVDGVEMEQWQYEVTAGGRIWYCIDDDRATVWMTDASVGHPKATE